MYEEQILTMPDLLIINDFILLSTSTLFQLFWILWESVVESIFFFILSNKLNPNHLLFCILGFLKVKDRHTQLKTKSGNWVQIMYEQQGSHPQTGLD